MTFRVRSVARHACSALVALGLSGGSAFAQFSAPLSVPPPTPAASQTVPILRDAGLDQKLDSHLPFDAAFVDQDGRDVTLGQYFNGTRPVALALVYYECPMLCSQILHGLVGSLEALTFDAGRDFDVLVVSFDPGETPAMATKSRADFLQRYKRAGADSGVHFLTGRKEAIDRLTSAVGFRYAYDAAIDQYAHPALVTIVTGDGRVSKYLLGIDFAPRDLRFAFIEAAGNRIGSLVDQAVLFCYHYDPASGKYGFAVTNAVRVAGLATVFGLAGFIIMSLRRERRQANAVKAATGIR